MTDRHFIIGAGPVGRHVAEALAARGSEVLVATRSGTDTGIAGVQHLSLDASDADALSTAAQGASVLYNCANPGDYTSWETFWPPLANSILTAAERSGAVLAITGNLYPYGPLDVAMVEGMPDAATDHKGALRARMWADAKAANDAGRLRAVEVRGSDYVGRGVGENGHITRVMPAALAGKSVRVMDDANQPHSWTDVYDEAQALIAAAENDQAWGHIWHAPTNAPRTAAEAINDVLASVGKPAVKVKRYPLVMTRSLAKVNALFRELGETSYQRSAPYVLDSSRTEKLLGLTPSPWDEVCRRTADQ
ncbi:MAG: epimerase [Aeromicrobium sp.]|nr:epimerase [Aeromicrobium sp.]